MSLLQDILAALDRWAEWKRMRDAPARVDELEKRLTALEAKTPKQAGRPCPACGEPAMRRLSNKPMPGPFGALGARVETWQCSACGDTEEKTITA